MRVSYLSSFSIKLFFVLLLMLLIIITSVHTIFIVDYNRKHTLAPFFFLFFFLKNHLFPCMNEGCQQNNAHRILRNGIFSRKTFLFTNRWIVGQITILKCMYVCMAISTLARSQMDIHAYIRYVYKRKTYFLRHQVRSHMK